ncbi:ABATE domain-containing protein [Nocardioides sp.]|uniref:CGNR zinc finger domain-containing protein n=1 Tax=Nocardioides sp. TaxID=35761 RepID=UPI0035B038F2
MRMAIDLVNAGESHSSLETMDDLSAFLDRHEVRSTRTPIHADLAQLRRLSGELREVLGASRDAAARRVNRILTESDPCPRLARHGDHDWHLHYDARDGSVASMVAARAAMAVACFIRADELSTVARCSRSGCRAYFVDLSRNRHRRYCSARCSNSDAVAAFRTRRASSSATSSSTPRRG